MNEKRGVIEESAQVCYIEVTTWKKSAAPGAMNQNHYKRLVDDLIMGTSKATVNSAQSSWIHYGGVD